jgi:RNA polymerase sigma-70 factor (ECF subfamily)
LCFVIEEKDLIAVVPQTKGRPLPEEFEELFREHSKFIYRTAYRVTGNSEDAEDVLQNLFVQMLRRDLPPEFGRNPKAYLYRAAVNLSLNVIRTHGRRSHSDVVRELKDPSTPEQSRGEAEMVEELRLALSELNPKAAEILILRHVHGFTDAEIADLLGTTRGTIAVSLFRSRARLRRAIRNQSGGKS